MNQETLFVDIGDHLQDNYKSLPSRPITINMTRPFRNGRDGFRYKFENQPVLKSDSLHEALLQSCDGAVSGGGAFSWASKGGIDLLLCDDTFLPLIQKGQFELIVGTDAVTTPAA